MKFAKSDQETNDFFAKITPISNPEVEVRKMFGFPCCFLNEQMFMGVYGKQIILRLPEAEREGFLKMLNSEVFSPSPGKVMKEYVVMPPQVLKNKKSLSSWIKLSMVYVKTLPKKKATKG